MYKNILAILFFILFGAMIYSCSTTRQVQSNVVPKNISFDNNVKPILNKYCIKCHSDFNNKEVVAGNMETMISLIEKKIMPPKGDRPTALELAILKAWDGVK